MESQILDNDIINVEMSVTKKIFNLGDEVEVCLNTIGWTSRVYIINNGQYVAKFPRYSQVKKEYEAEVQACNLIADNDFQINVPKIVQIGDGYSYIAYEGVEGQTLDTVSGLRDDEQIAIGLRLGEFLRHFQKLKMSKGQNQNLEDEILESLEKYQSGLSTLKSHFTKKKLDQIHRFVTLEFPRELKRLGIKQVLSHGDLGYWNMIYMPDGSTGIIDFGDVGYYDESRDFVGLSDQSVLDNALTVYGESEALRSKIEIRKLILPVMELPYYIGKSDSAGINRIVRKIDSTFKTMCSLS